MTQRMKHRGRKRGHTREDGAAMLIVMLILLMATSTAVFAVHATTSEIRASGHMRRSMQTEYVGETGATAAMAWVDQVNPATLVDIIERSSSPDMDPFLGPAYGDRRAHRLYGQHLPFDQAVVDKESLGGTKQAYDPLLMIDIYDYVTYAATLPGFRSDGFGRLKFLRATYTSRGRTRPVSVGSEYEPHRLESASDARAHGISGPFAP